MAAGWTKDARGLSLVEVMMALLIFSIGVLAVATMQGTGMAAVSTAQRGIYNSVAAAGHLEQMLSLPFDDPLLMDNDGGFYPEAPDHGPFVLADGRSSIEWEVVDDFPVPGAKRIRVTVRRRDRGGTAGVFSYEHVKTRDYR